LHHGSGDCPVERDVVKIPGREIRIETASPRVIVSDVARHGRMRGFFPPLVPMGYGGPYVATFLPFNMGVQPTPTHGSDTGALDAIHALERHASAIAQERAARQAGIDAADQALERVRGSLNRMAQAGNGVRAADADLLNQLKQLNARMDKIENLLVIHDNLLKDIA